jgi:asparagine synthase (glutamine-hydrolysing)
MCGIWGILGKYKDKYPDLQRFVKHLEARGPEYTSVNAIPETDVALGFTRLAINGLTPVGHQPFSHEGVHIVCNGELYNYRSLAERWSIPLADGTSDCAILPFLAKKLGMTELCRTLDGVFAFVIVDTAQDRLWVARDPYGVRPLFQGTTTATDGSTIRMWSSELKGFDKECTDVKPFPPGTWASYKLSTGALISEYRYHTIPHVKLAAFEDRGVAQAALRASLLTAVQKRLLSDRPIGALLSGGVDSSLIAAIAARELAKTGARLHTFSIGMPGSTDLEYAQLVADKIGSIHHNVIVSPDDFLQAIPQVVRDIESYDITSVRASVGNWLIGKYIKEHTDIKVVFNGDGSDEIGGGYLYFYAAPSDEEFEAESERLLEEIHLFDVLRSDRSMAAHGLEARTPFLDKNVVATWRACATALRRPVKGPKDRAQAEKQILREAFVADDYLPSAVLWRKKEAFSDGVSATHDSWYKRCQGYAAAGGATLEQIKTMTAEWHNPPQTQEAFYYRQIFEEMYGVQAACVIPHMWLPRWIAGASDPSARTLSTLY